MFSLAESWGMIPTGRNPCRHVRYYREQSRERFLTPEEFRRLGAALKKFEAQGSMQPSAVAASPQRAPRPREPEPGHERPRRVSPSEAATPFPRINDASCSGVVGSEKARAFGEVGA